MAGQIRFEYSIRIQKYPDTGGRVSSLLNYLELFNDNLISAAARKVTTSASEVG